MDDATRRQVQAAEPNSSTWLSANAGSGKTRVLTDRVARLLLEGVQPQNILCLTYTKAAASEMQNRLFERLGRWSMSPDVVLEADLGRLGVEIRHHETLAEARRLFARAIETPGGLRIQTIHSYCASLLRRFPLEAGVSPGFAEMDDRSGALLRAEVIDQIAEDSPEVLDAVARHLSGDDLDPLTFSILSEREAFASPVDPDPIYAAFDLPTDATLESIVEACFDGDELSIAQQVLTLTRKTSKTYRDFGDALHKICQGPLGVQAYSALCDLFLYKSGDTANQSKSVNFPQSNHRKAVEALEPILPDLHAFMDRVAAAKQQEVCLKAVRRALALHHFARTFLSRYEAAKIRRGWLDFDDLILKTRGLLTDPHVAAWVLYRLDGGLDHILVDEAQDTSPTQWQVIEQLAQEFTAGQGARDDVVRTIFVVGDKKQSIYSFQGADPEEFDRMQEHFRAGLETIQAPFRALDLEYSFRSSDAVLRFVDRLIDIPQMRHRAFHDAFPGRVDVWPALPPATSPEKADWFDPVDLPAQNDPRVVLAENIAEFLAGLIGRETLPRSDGTARLVRASDILILVRRRSDVFAAIIRSLKAKGLPVAGADRLKLGAELAVKDICAVLSFLATQDDDLSLAATLKSPLFGWTEQDLFDLAARRGPKTLWQAFRDRQHDYPQTAAVLKDLRDTTDFLRPFDLIERILTRHDGRLNLLGRLGQEAEDGIDVLLQQALAYERAEVPSLTGFLTWMQTEDIEVKRQLDSAGDLIRVMTVHGAKGLEAPIVILPDTAKRRRPKGGPVLRLANGIPVWRANAAEQPDAMREAAAARQAVEDAEDERLLYVAATRAESWLIVAGAGDVGEGLESWFKKAEGAVEALGDIRIDTPLGEGQRFAHGVWPDTAPPAAIADDAATVTVPDWAKTRAAPLARPAQPRTPSDLGGAKALAGEAGQDTETALRHGSMVHLLLELGPGALPRAADILGGPFPGVDPSAAIAEATRVFAAPALAPLFAPEALSEVSLAATLPGLGPLMGQVDKLVPIGPGRMLAVDFKTNAVVPDAPLQVPEGLLRQMGAYLGMLEHALPGTQVDLAILWTQTADLMPLTHEIVRAALARAATS